MELLNLTANTGNKETILKAIDSLTKENYISVFCKYINSSHKEGLTEFEAGYIQSLEWHLADMGKTLLRLEYANKEFSELLDLVVDWGISSPCSFEVYLDNNELGSFIRNTVLPTKTKLSIVKGFMITRLDDYCLALEKTAADKDAERKQKRLEDCERSLEYYQKLVKEIRGELGL